MVSEIGGDTILQGHLKDLEVINDANNMSYSDSEISVSLLGFLIGDAGSLSF